MSDDPGIIFAGVHPPAMAVDPDAVVRGGRRRRRRQRVAATLGATVAVTLVVVAVTMASTLFRGPGEVPARPDPPAQTLSSAPFTHPNTSGKDQTYRVLRTSSPTTPGEVTLVLQRRDGSGSWGELARQTPFGTATSPARTQRATALFGAVQPDVRQVEVTLSDGSSFEESPISLEDLNVMVYVLDGLSQSQLDDVTTVSYSVPR